MEVALPYLPDDDALPALSQVYSWQGWTTQGSINVQCVVTEDFNGDGRDDIAAHFFQSYGSATDPHASTPNRLVIFLAQPDGSFVDGTQLLFGTAVVTLTGMSRKVDVGDLNGDGRLDWAYALSREDGRNTPDWHDFAAVCVAIVSQPDGTYSVMEVGEPDWYHAVRIFESGGEGHIVVQGFTRPDKPWIGEVPALRTSTNDDFVLQGDGTAFQSMGDLPADASTFIVLPPGTPGGEVTQVVSIFTDLQNIDHVPGLVERDEDGNWSLVDALAPLPAQVIPFVSWNGARGSNSIVTIDNLPVVGASYPESAVVRLDAYTPPLVLLNFTAGLIAAPREDGYYYENDQVHDDRPEPLIAVLQH